MKRLPHPTHLPHPAAIPSAKPGPKFLKKQSPSLRSLDKLDPASHLQLLLRATGDASKVERSSHGSGGRGGNARRNGLACSTKRGEKEGGLKDPSKALLH